MKRAAPLLLLLALALGCEASPVAPADAGLTDVGTDIGNDLGFDVDNDVGTDVDNDVGNDVPRDVPVGDVGVTLAIIEERVLRPHCAIPSCHASAEPTGRMRLDEDYPASTLRGVPARGISCSGLGLVRVTPGDPANSLLFHKISEDAPPCGSRMPQGAEALSPELIALVRGWIAAGAP